MSRDISSYFLFEKTLNLLSSRDIEVAYENNQTLYYAGVELTLAALSVAQLVEVLARTCFGLIIVPYYLFSGQSNQVRDYTESIGMVLIGLAITITSLYQNLFSKTALIPSIGPLWRLFGVKIEMNAAKMCGDIESIPKTCKEKTQTKEEAQYVLIQTTYKLMEFQ